MVCEVCVIVFLLGTLLHYVCDIAYVIAYVITIDILIAIACGDCECRNGFFSNVEGVFFLTS